ncbi:MAG: RNA polymerase sigma factor [Pseudonocardiaceae bacterium]
MTGQGNAVYTTAPPPRPETTRGVPDLPARAGDDKRPLAWEELINRYGRLVRSTVASFRLQPADAEDAVQNTWLRVLERIDTLRDPERLGGWLAATASQQCLALLRCRQREIPDDLAGKQLVATEEEPDAAVVTREVHQAVNTAVGELTRRRQKLIRMLFAQPDNNYAAISRATGMPQGSIGPTRLRVLRELRRTLEQRGFGPQSGLDVSGDVGGEPTEGDRTGSHLLDDLLDKAERVLREKLEPTVIGTGSSQGTGDEHLDELLHRADAALRESLGLSRRNEKSR